MKKENKKVFVLKDTKEWLVTIYGEGEVEFAINTDLVEELQ